MNAEIAKLHGRICQNIMKNLKRALWMTLKYRWSLVGSFLCSLCVAVLWGANLGAVYPFVEIVLHDKSLHQWVDNRVEKSVSAIEKLELEIAALKTGDPSITTPASKTQLSISRLQSEITTEQKRLDWNQTLKPYITQYAPQSAFQTLVWLIVLMIVGTIFRGIFLMGNMVLVARVGQRTVLDLQNDVFRNVLDMEVSEMDVKGTGDLISRIRGETGVIGQAIMVLFGKTIREPMKMVACLVGAAVVNWRLLIFSCLICPIAGYLMITLAKVTKRANKKAIEESAKLLDRLYQALTYQRVVKAFTMEDGERDRFQNVANDVYKKGMRIAWFNSLSRINNELLGVSMISLSVLAGGYLVLNQKTELFGVLMSSTVMDFGSVMVFFGFLIGIADPLRKMADVYNTIQGGVVASDRVFPLIDQVPAVHDADSPTPIPSGELQIEFDDVKFAYDPGKPILKGVSAVIPSGASVAIMGHNGCGKSTLINLVPRFYDVGDGSIRIGGVDVRKAGLKQLRQRIGYVTQQTMLFNDTIAENIAYGQPDVDRDQVIAAAKKAHADEFIQELELGYDANIGEHGGKLSGGQRQRLSLARAILKDPDILILDEATSQIDVESENLIHQALSKFIKNRTTLIITHRISTLDLADYIILMSDGQVTDFGTHQQLLARCPDYQRLRSLDLEGAA